MSTRNNTQSMSTMPKAILMLDDFYLANKSSLRRYYHTPVKFSENPILHTGQTQQEKIPLLFGSVRYDPFVRKYRMWYMSCKAVRSGMNVHDKSHLALAESSDGIRWKRANINGKNSNYLFGSNRSEIFIETGSVLINTEGPRDKRYLMVYCAKDKDNPADRFYRLAFSANGINWRRAWKISVTSPSVVDRHALLHNERTNEYLFFHRGQRPITKSIDTVDTYERTVCLQKSVDLKNWNSSTEVMRVDSKERSRGLNVYSLCPFYRENFLIGIYQLHNMCKEEEIVTTHLCWSYDDGKHWYRKKDEFIPLGGYGQWDRFNNAVADSPLIIDDTMYFYYSGRVYRHGGYEPKGRFDSGPNFAGIGFATMKLDRFASLSSSFDGGELITKKFSCPENSKIYLNANCRWGRIEISVSGISNSGYDNRVGRVVVIEGKDSVFIPVNLRIPCNIPFSLKIKLFNAQLFAIYRK